MIRETSYMQTNVGMKVAQLDHPRKRHILPALKLEKVKAMRAKHRAMLNSLFPKPVRLKRLMHDIEHSFAKEFASVIGSVDYAEARLAGLLAAIKELSEKIEMLEHRSIEEIKEYIQQDTRIHELFEDLVFECAKYSFEEVSN